MCNEPEITKNVRNSVSNMTEHHYETEQVFLTSPTVQMKDIQLTGKNISNTQSCVHNRVSKQLVCNYYIWMLCEKKWYTVCMLDVHTEAVFTPQW
jgi:hypothetical protein